jgi:predicted XRE-type DNA-binding protein
LPIPDTATPPTAIQAVPFLTWLAALYWSLYKESRRWVDSGNAEVTIRQKTKPRVTRSSENVFRDLGFPPGKAQHLLVRADLMIRLEKELGSRRLKQTQAAELLGISQPRVSDLLRGHVELFSADALIDMLARLGIKVRIVASTRRGVA